MYSQAEKNHIVNYMSRLTQTLSSDLRRYKGHFGHEWQGIDHSDWSMVLYFCEDGVHGRIIPKWLGTWVKYSNKNYLDEVSHTKVPEAKVHKGESCQFILHVKKTESEVMLEIGLNFTGAGSTKGVDIQLRHEKGHEASKLTAPQIFIANSSIKKEVIINAVKTGIQPDDEIRQVPFPWCFAFFSVGHGTSALQGFDQDPFIEAHGLADHILNVAGIIEKPRFLYEAAIREITEAVNKDHLVNEQAIHEVVKKYPFIIRDRHDYTSFESKPSVIIEETIAPDNRTKRRVEPDFIYDLYDEQSLIVEIEAASKRVLKKTEETSYQLPRAESVAACFQIHNYKKIFDGIGFRQFREQRGLPDRWGLKYLLVVGSEHQPDFDIRSWNNLRDFLANLGVTVRTWDYFIDRLNRIMKASEYNAAGP